MQKHPQWKSKVQEIFESCQSEIKRTTQIGKKMLNASKTNSCLHEAYEELGVLTCQALQRGELEWSNDRVAELLKTIQSCSQDLEEIEAEVNKIKFAASGPEDVSRDKNTDKDHKTSKSVDS